MQNEVRLNIRIPAELLEKAKQAAKDKSLSVSALTRLLLINYVEQIENDKQNKTSKE